MALIQCEECKNEISNKAAACPKCGAPTNIYNINKVHKKNFIVVTVCLIAAFILGYTIVRDYQTKKAYKEKKELDAANEKYQQEKEDAAIYAKIHPQ